MISRSLATATLKPMVLAILGEGPEYGYRLIQRIQDVSKGEIDWTTGTLYPFLHGLENDGLLESYWVNVDDAPRRKYYRLTVSGESALAFEKRQWYQVHAMLTQLLGPPPVQLAT